MPPVIAGCADVATSGTVAAGLADQPVGSFGGPGALKLLVGRVKLDITALPGNPAPPAPRAAASVPAAIGP
ncbi:MAG TPA: hypothetical protein VF874_09250, partial [Mycobacterium sp.]